MEISKKARALPLMEAAMRAHGREMLVKEKENKALRDAGLVLVDYLRSLSVGDEIKPHHLKPIRAALEIFMR